MSAAPAPKPRWCIVGAATRTGTGTASTGRSSTGTASDELTGETGIAIRAHGDSLLANSGEERGRGFLAAVDIDAEGNRSEPVLFSVGEFASFVSAREQDGPRRWVWHDTAARYPELLSAGVRIERCYDLRLCHQILAGSDFVTERRPLLQASAWAAPFEAAEKPDLETEPTLFEVEAEPETMQAEQAIPASLNDAIEEFDRQRAALASSPSEHRLSLLLSAESAGALVAVELSHAGVPWDAVEHDRILSESLGPRPAPGSKPDHMVQLGGRTREALGDPTASLDSPPKLLRALRAAGIETGSTSRWELAEHEHPAIPLLLQYKKLARLFSANGWAWLDEWVRDGRYRPVYVPGGVVTGRWASSGGGALQLPRQLRPALRADPGWLLVIADVSQLEPRALAAMSGDRAMAAAGRGKDLYTGIVESGAVDTRDAAKIAVLGAMYGSTTGDAGRLVPRLRRTFPRAMRLVDQAAAVGEQGGTVSTWLGRSSPAPGAEWHRIQEAASLPDASRRDEEFARRSAREFGRFTRNFVVQGTAAEWALAWMAELRLRLDAFDEVPEARAALASGPVFSRRPHLSFFLHDELIVHTPREHAEAVAHEVEAAANAAGQLLFGDAPVDFRLDLRISERATKD